MAGNLSVLLGSGTSIQNLSPEELLCVGGAESTTITVSCPVKGGEIKLEECTGSEKVDP